MKRFVLLAERPSRPAGAIFGPMRTPRIPETWQNLRPGDQVFSRLPLHRIEAMAKLMPDRVFAFLPAPTGYWVKCEGVSETRPPDATLN